MPFPQHPRKHREPSLFTARDFRRYISRRTGRPSPNVPPNVVLVFGDRWREYLPRHFPRAFDDRTGIFRADRSSGVYRVAGPGAPFATIVIEELAALGVRRFLLVGIAGSLRPELRVGDLVVCTRALRDEGTSHHYARAARWSYPSARLTRRLISRVESEGVPYASGPSWTTDAPYRETPAEVRRYRSAGIATVEMEAAAAFTVARHLGIESAALFVVSDHLDEAGWEPRFHDARPALYGALGLALRTFGRGAGGRHSTGRRK